MHLVKHGSARLTIEYVANTLQWAQKQIQRFPVKKMYTVLTQLEKRILGK